jgi:hypothetical protein
MSKRMTHQEICEKWEAVSRAKNVNHQRGTKAAITQCRQFLTAIHQQADVEQARYRYLAQRLCDHFWSHNVAHRTDQTLRLPRPTPEKKAGVVLVLQSLRPEEERRGTISVQ